ncbi:hypothetical protein BDU57DRAFT_203805 [Ampelomyces quisqualis]|uniref:Uncharacterized protein n=1 Tax=Ampelomyces quisqualis TaxID=50730 RepID=A0A6A5QVG3_AMPQU|nr:hypothetical protein BDU57DRAFT_203805 [Ampelomyces quisqualis]
MASLTRVFTGLDGDELGYWTALLARVVLGVMSPAQIVVRGDGRDSSFAVWLSRFAGRLFGLNFNYTYCWWVWPEAHGYLANPIAVVMMVTWVLVDLAYLVVRYNVGVSLPSNKPTARSGGVDKLQ